jgi:hypothetical protein
LTTFEVAKLFKALQLPRPAWLAKWEHYRWSEAELKWLREHVTHRRAGESVD